MVLHTIVHMPSQEFIRAARLMIHFGCSLVFHLHWWCTTGFILSWTRIAGGILLYCTIICISYLQSDANPVQDWGNCNYMFLNSSKCKYMPISRKWNRMNTSLRITINGQVLETVPTFKYILGLLLPSGLSTLKKFALKEKKAWAYCTTVYTCMLTRKLFANYMYHYDSTWSMSLDTHLLKAHRSLHVKWLLKTGTETWIQLTCFLLQTEGCT